MLLNCHKIAAEMVCDTCPNQSVWTIGNLNFLTCRVYHRSFFGVRRLLTYELNPSRVKDSVNYTLLKPFLDSKRVVKCFQNYLIAHHSHPRITSDLSSDHLRLPEILSIAELEEILPELGSDEKIDTWFVEDLIHISDVVAHTVTGLEDWCVASEAQVLHFACLLKLLGCLRAESLLLHHGQHVGFVLDLHGYLQEYVLYILCLPGRQTLIHFLFESVQVKCHF